MGRFVPSFSGLKRGMGVIKFGNFGLSFFCALAFLTNDLFNWRMKYRFITVLHFLKLDKLVIKIPLEAGTVQYRIRENY